MVPRVEKAIKDIEQLWPAVQTTMEQTIKLANDVQALAAGIAPELMLPITQASSEPKYDVRWVQQGLQQLGFDSGPIDGIMGPRTQMAISAFQQAHGLMPDGWFGVMSEAKLDQLLRERTV